MKKYFQKWYNEQENKPPYVDGEEFAKRAWNAALAEVMRTSQYYYLDGREWRDFKRSVKNLKWK